ncbi:MAG TPA: basic secretory protein-like protein [Verrucomicrobiota bacterium]|nr:basic secretory protein-like protein [Verrucomicrobiota bacterium]
MGPCRAAAGFHVAPGGNDAWSGTLAAPDATGSDGPFATIDRARRAIRQLKADGNLPRGGVQVTVHGGLYRFASPLELTAADSGTAEAPVVYRAAPRETARWLGGITVTDFKPVTNSAVLSRFEETARGQVFEADLRAQGLSDYGTAGGGGLELFFRDAPMPLSRWPNTGFIRIAEVSGRTPVDVRGTKGCVEGLFSIVEDRPGRWTAEPEVWVHGYWFWDWSDQRQRLRAFDPAAHTLEIEPPYHHYGYRKGQWFYAYNLLAEIDQPGEWYLDRQAGILYFWPPAPLEAGQATVSVLPTLLRMNDVSHTTFQGFTFEGVRDTAIVITGGQSNRIAGCTIRNTGGTAISVGGGAGHTVASCTIYQCGAGGISLSGGDRTTLTPGGHVADNNDIHHYGRWRPMYSAGISLNGVGLCASRNRIHHAPHQAVAFGGNDHRIERNEIHHVCFESNDAGAIYAGRDWTMRGTVIRHNYLHDIQGFEGRGCVGVYLDDMYSGTAIIGNVFERVTRAAFIGGGRDCRVENNIFVDCRPALHIDARALGWAKYHADAWVKEGREKGTLSGIAYQKPPYRGRYPGLDSILAEDPCAPRGNVVARNLCVGGRWDDVEAKARPLVRFENNLVDADPRLVDAAASDFRLEPDSPAWKLGFERIPLEAIGLDAGQAVVADHNATAHAEPSFTFPNVPPPARNDAAAGIIPVLVDGRQDPNGADLASLVDGTVPTDEDQPGRNFFFAPGTDGGRLLLDLGRPVDLAQVNTYSWHAGPRGPQVYVLFASAGEAASFDPRPPRGNDPASCGWLEIARVDTRPKDSAEAGGQYGVSVRAAGKANARLGTFRYLLFEISRTENQDPFGNTFYSEIDVVEQGGPALERVATDAPPRIRDTIQTDGGAQSIVIDTTEAPDLTDWARSAVGPMVQEWYPKLIRLLPSEGYTAPAHVSIVFSRDMTGVAATSGTRIRCAASWIRQNLKGEALGALFHELVHVVQQYGRAPRRPGATRAPVWLTEGLTDYLRFYVFEPQTRGAEITRRNLSRARYDGSYRITANFLNWIVGRHGQEVIPKLNAAIREGRYSEETWTSLTGHAVADLGAAWKAALETALGAEPPATPAPGGPK